MKLIGDIPEAIVEAVVWVGTTSFLAGQNNSAGSHGSKEAAATAAKLLGDEFARRDRQWLATLSDVVAYGGHQDKDGLVDSCAISTVADAMVTLSEYGMMELDGEPVGRRVLGRWTDRREKAT